ncbi:chromosomal replication initiator protein DnaA [Rubrobacter xylanophilus DSM 9941]|uniref:Chromosomal replication initiator protein DnaA n=1 Tax=Rubrobacter xylanophilus (strain DSM 9941 / JCM 11954 / NBRC 16129 / PRD-1) TaxID=266117 RepID=Q1B046_RUBXD|nr:chromosomal replication initiator protein DnaA [Rubrobacter xylanophilus]ABG02982.1 chromosomal replication initiator protein DnaA [Rubrobacter xylanophilus DSM 9941]
MQSRAEEVWNEVLDRVSEHINAPSLKVWFEGTRPVQLYEDGLEISVPNTFAKEYIESRFRPLLEEALDGVLGQEETSIIVSVGGQGRRAGREETSAETGAESVLSARTPRSLKAKYTFDSFVIGAGNRFAHAAALAVAENPGVVYNPLFIYGGVGLGKTHLLRAVGHYVEDQDPTMRVRYVTCEQFTNDFINSMRDNAPLEFQKRYRENDVLLIDDIQFLENKVETQEAFFHTFNALYEENKQIVIASDRHPKYLQTLENRLVSRFEWGLVTDIQPPDLETRIAILRKKAMMDRLEVDDEVLTFIASKVSTNIRELEGALVRILAYASLYGRQVTVALAEEVLRDILPDSDYREIPIELIQHEVCRYFGISKEDLVGTSRSKAFAYPRQVAMYLSRELTDESLPKIGKAFGGRDHSTVMHATNKIANLINSDRDTFNQIHEITYHIKSKR